MSTNRWLFRFGDFELDAAAYELRRKGRRLRLARQPMDLLLLLVEHPRALVSREESAKRLWTPDVFIDIDAGIHTAILRIRQTLRDSAESPRFVESVPGKGYRFVAAVTFAELRPRRGVDTRAATAAGGEDRENQDKCLSFHESSPERAMIDALCVQPKDHDHHRSPRDHAYKHFDRARGLRRA